jgi:hypothetical protein
MAELWFHKTMKKHFVVVLILATILIGKIASAQTNAVVFNLNLDNETKNILREATTDMCEILIKWRGH